MTNEIKHLPTEPKALREMVLSLQSQVKNLTAEKLHLIEQFRLAQQQRFGTSNEAHPAQAIYSTKPKRSLMLLKKPLNQHQPQRRKSLFVKNCQKTLSVKCSFTI